MFRKLFCLTTKSGNACVCSCITIKVVMHVCVHASVMLNHFSRVQLLVILWTVACQGSLKTPWDFFKQEYWSRLPFPPPGGLPDPRIKPKCPVSPALQMDSLGLRR